MSARLARIAFGSATRRTQTTVASASSRVARRAMSSTSHGAQAKSSDTPWIIGSTIVFLPAFLYLVSPSARKQEHLPHNDKHDFPTLKHNEEHAPEPASTPEPTPEKAEAPAELMKDDEGTVADVGASIAVAEGEDAPKAAQEPEHQAASLDEAKSAPVEEQSSASQEQNEASSDDAPTKQEA